MSSLQGGAAVVKLSGDLHLGSARWLRAEVTRISAAGIREIVICLSGGDPLDEETTQALASARQLLQACGGRLTVVHDDRRRDA